MRLLLSCAAALLLVPMSADAAPRTLRLAPPSATLAIRAYAMGFMPVDAQFARFDGTLTYDPATTGHCTATLTAQVDSIQLDNAAIRATMLGADFLDAARFPTLRFTGSCADSKTAEGSLTLRGVTRPLGTTLAWTPHLLVTEAEIRRALWGMDARPLMVGPMIRIRLAVALP
ncbi:MAG TPA: YceI family protein [Acetobacteraceae bacterium]|jgi:polyisoprenoid-binding protein YceI|nr:YceI family protein [Acetobacteraceae bacterium]